MVKLETKNISKSYGNKKIIENINITLHENECVALLGMSGIRQNHNIQHNISAY